MEEIQENKVVEMLVKENNLDLVVKIALMMTNLIKNLILLYVLLYIVNVDILEKPLTSVTKTLNYLLKLKVFKFLLEEKFLSLINHALLVKKLYLEEMLNALIMLISVVYLNLNKIKFN